MCNINTEAMKRRDITKTGTGPLKLKNTSNIRYLL